MKWEPIKEVFINRKPATLWQAREHNEPRYAITLFVGDMIREPRGYEASLTRKDAFYMAKLRNGK